MSKEHNTQYVNTKAIAAMFRVSSKTVATWREQGCPCLNVNPYGQRPTLRYSREAVEEWLLGNAQTGKEAQA